MIFFGKIFKKTILFIFLVELFSLFGYLLPDFNKFAFFILVILTLILSLYKLEYGVYILLAELFIGSKGYLLFFEHSGVVVSIRIALWLIVISVWAGKLISDLIKTKKLKIEFFQSSYLYYFLVLFLFIAWGLVNGILNNQFGNVFFDFNNWLYFLLIFPIYHVILSKTKNTGAQEMKRDSSVFGFRTTDAILQIFTASIIWLSVKTFFLLFIFSHNLTGIIFELYRWVRISGVGEITQIQGGFYRVFFQSHIFILIGFFIFILLLSKIIANNSSHNILNTKKRSLTKEKEFYLLLGIVCITLAVILISFSRSFWLGLILGILLFYIYLIWKKVQWKKTITGLLILTTFISFLIIVLIVKFPFPPPTGGFSTSELLSERAGEITGEAAVSSRWALLPALWNEIKKAPVLGKGFGATVTYKSSDPRVLKTSPTGEYTTYAFEWGWLDIWLKLGIFGLIAYLALIGKIIINGIKQSDNIINIALIIGLAVISVVSIFSPYMNHPLGIGFLIIVSVIINFSKIKKKAQEI